MPEKEHERADSAALTVPTAGAHWGKAEKEACTPPTLELASTFFSFAPRRRTVHRFCIMLQEPAPWQTIQSRVAQLHVRFYFESPPKCPRFHLSTVASCILCSGIFCDTNLVGTDYQKGQALPLFSKPPNLAYSHRIACEKTWNAALSSTVTRQ